MKKTDYKKFEKFIGMRIFDCEYSKILKVVREARESDGWGRKYENVSHFVRASVVRCVREELKVIADRKAQKKIKKNKKKVKE